MNGLEKLETFESLEKLLDKARIKPRKLRSSHSVNHSKTPWNGTNTFEQAAKLVKNGWPEGSNMVLSMRASIDYAVRELVTSRCSNYGYDISGDFVDVGRFMTGEPECFMKEDGYGSVSKPVIKIIANIGASSSISTDNLIARGVGIVAAVDIMESLGRRVELWIGKSTEYRGEAKMRKHELRVLIKSASQPLDIDRVTFAIAHPACLRRLCFSILEHDGMDTNYCHSKPIKDDEAIVTDCCYQPRDFSKKELLESVASLCSKMGIEISPEEIKSLAK